MCTKGPLPCPFRWTIAGPKPLRAPCRRPGHGTDGISGHTACRVSGSRGSPATHLGEQVRPPRFDGSDGPARFQPRNRMLDPEDDRCELVWARQRQRARPLADRSGPRAVEWLGDSASSGDARSSLADATSSRPDGRNRRPQARAEAMATTDADTPAAWGRGACGRWDCPCEPTRAERARPRARATDDQIRRAPALATRTCVDSAVDGSVVQRRASGRNAIDVDADAFERSAARTGAMARVPRALPEAEMQEDNSAHSNRSSSSSSIAAATGTRHVEPCLRAARNRARDATGLASDGTASRTRR